MGTTFSCTAIQAARGQAVAEQAAGHALHRDKAHAVRAAALDQCELLFPGKIAERELQQEAYNPESMASCATARRWFVMEMWRIFPCFFFASSAASYRPSSPPGFGQKAGLWNW